MIDTQTEAVVSFADATKIIPGRPHVSQVYRWAQRGLGGIKLEWLQVGGSRFTSREALDRFFSALTAARTGTMVPTSTPAARSRSVKSAVSELKSAGFEIGSAV